MKILLIEDDLTLNKLVAKALRRMKYSVEQAFNGDQAWELYLTNEYHLIILDLNLPYISGIDILKMIRNSDRKTKILVLSARSSIEDKILGFDNGATDYLTKPFDILELAARISNLLSWKFEHDENELILGKLILNKKNKLFYYDSLVLDLTRKEYSILEYLIMNKEKYSSSEEIILQVWENESAMFSNTFKFHIYQLRKKLSLVSLGKVNILSKRNQGYKIIVNK